MFMIKEDLFYKNLAALMNGTSLFVFCNGYDGWNWGFPVNPICLNYHEYLFVHKYFRRRFNIDLATLIINNNGWDSSLPDNIVRFTDRKICSFISYPLSYSIEGHQLVETNIMPSLKDWNKFLFKTESEIQKSEEDKRKVLLRIKEDDVGLIDEQNC